MLTVTYRHDRFSGYTIRTDISFEYDVGLLFLMGPGLYSTPIFKPKKFKRLDEYLRSLGFSKVIQG